MLAQIKPDAVLAYNAIADHLAVVEACAPKGISVMVEKPLAVNNQQAERIAALAKQYNIHVLTNYETTWYPSNQQVNVMVNQEHAVGEIRRWCMMDIKGQKKLDVVPSFWLAHDPIKMAVLGDFGCYGANLMTWLMKGKTPLAVTAVTRQIKPDIYPKLMTTPRFC
jgi:predicted dehydrogenase